MSRRRKHVKLDSMPAASRAVSEERRYLDEQKQKMLEQKQELYKDAASIFAGTSATVLSSSDGISGVNPSNITNDSFQSFFAKIGIGTDNLASTAGYGFNPITRVRTMLEWIYRGSWVAGVAVDVVADDMTRAGADIKGELEPDDIDKINERMTDLGVWKSINSGIKWGRLYGGALCVIMIEGQNMTTPLRPETVGKDAFKGLLTLDRWQVEPSLNDLVDDYGPDFGKPRYYKVLDEAGFGNIGNIHFSRVIRFEGVELPHQQKLMESLWGMSILERAYDRLTAFDNATQGASQLVYKSYLRVIKIDKFREIVAMGGKMLEGLVKMVDMMRRFQSIEGITIIDGKDEFQASSHGAFSGLSDALMQFGQQLSGSFAIPLTKLFGQSPAGMNATGESDMRNYYDGINQNQNMTMKTPLTRVYQCCANSLGITWKGVKGFGISFRSLWQLSDVDKVTIAMNAVTAVTTAMEAGLKRETGLKELKQSAETTGYFSNITDEDLADAKELDENPPEPELGAEGASGKAAEGGGLLSKETNKQKLKDWFRGLGDW